MTQQADMLRAQVRTVADSESRPLLKPLAGLPKDGMRVEVWVSSPEPRRRSVYDSRNLSGAPAASLVIGCAAP